MAVAAGGPESGAGEIQATRGVEPVEEMLIGDIGWVVLPAAEAEADQVHRARGAELEARVGGDEGLEEGGEADLPADVGAQALDAVVADDEPELEGAEAAAEGDSPIAVVDHGAGLGGGVAEVLG